MAWPKIWPDLAQKLKPGRARVRVTIRVWVRVSMVRVVMVRNRVIVTVWVSFGLQLARFRFLAGPDFRHNQKIYSKFRFFRGQESPSGV